jgi:sortase (surface protein transpeptidase)
VESSTRKPQASLFKKQISAQQQHKAILSTAAANQVDVVGRIEIPRLGMAIAILEGTSAHTLRLGVGHIEGTALPGEQGNSGMSAAKPSITLITCYPFYLIGAAPERFVVHAYKEQ